MELDRTRIVIRERNWSDLIDLSIVVMREYAGPISYWGVLGALPFFLLNMLALRPLLDVESIMLGNEMNTTEELLYFRYFVHAAVLVFLEGPFAMQALTYYLGQAVFVEKPSRQEVWKHVRASFWNCVLILGILRGGLLGLPLVFFIPRNTPFDPFIELFLLFFLVMGIGTAIRIFRPFAPEMLMLERSPLRKSKDGSGVRFSNRSYGLHQPISGDLVGRFLVMIFVYSGLFVSLFLSERFLTGVLFGAWLGGWWETWILIPAMFWFLAIASTVFRFLSYLDARIRLEGWEVELRLKAEALRLEPTL